jgi:serine protease Do
MSLLIPGAVRPRRLRSLGAVLLLVLAPPFAAPVRAAGPADGEISPAVQAALVQVEAFVQAAEGEEPRASGWSNRCPKCGEYHVNELDDALREERPATVSGYLVAGDRVLSADPMVHPRFVREWRVRLGDESVVARPAAWAADRRAMLFALERPLSAGRPLAFSPAAPTPYSVLTYSREKDGWSSLIQPLGGSWLVRADGSRFRPAPFGSVALAADGAPVAPIFGELLPADDSWKRAWGEWPWIDDVAHRRMLETTRRIADSAILLATLRLRPLPVQPGEAESYGGDEDAKATTIHALALVVSPSRAVVLRGLAPAVTARLERVSLALADGTSLSARFVASVTDFAAFVVEPEKPFAESVRLADTAWSTQRDRLLFTAEVSVAGEERRAWFGHRRCASVGTGFRGWELPDFGGDAESLFLFDEQGRLVGVPLAQRATPSAERWSSKPDPFPVQAARLLAYAGEPAAWADTRNAPRSAEDERRLAWLGAEMQPLDADLAAAHGVSAQTENGGHGALVTHVYPGSPAERAGLAVGDVLLRILPVGAPRPIQVRAEAFAFSQQAFPWDRYDQIPDAYFDRIPRPWMPAETQLDKVLKDLGVGTAYSLDYARTGAVSTVSLVVERGPEHYGSAREADAGKHGLRVRELTFETRRFFQIPEGQPGLVIARVNAGGSAAVAGLKPYEIIVTVNDSPVATAPEFEAALAKAGAEPIRIGVRRMSQSRLVTLNPAAASPGS